MKSPPRTKVQRHPVHGVLLLDKPLGLSSNQALQKAKWLLRAEKAGHTGTLDPLATGVLPLCFGAATKFSQLHLDADKCYEAILLLGQTTATGDAEGEVLQTRPVPEITPAQLAAIEAQFTGPQQQTPPMYSALKKDGKALYEYARAGQTVEREPRNITIYELKLAPDQQTPARAAIKMIVKCSKGTYIRTLAEDIGEAIGCGGHLIALRRTASGSFQQAGCTTLEALEAMDEASRLAALLPVNALLAGFESVTLDDDNAGRFLSGLRRRGNWPDAEKLAVYSQSDAVLLGTAHTKAGELICDRLLSPLEVSAIRFRPPDAALANL